jgi:hypothetical protein
LLFGLSDDRLHLRLDLAIGPLRQGMTPGFAGARLPELLKQARAH